MKFCKTCGDPHLAKGYCRVHYRMPSQMNPKPVKSKEALKSAKKKKTTETLSQLIERAQRAFNASIRKRDLLADNTFVCISCGLYKPKREMEAGHFYPTRYSALRFHEDNVHGECHTCNCLDDDHLEGYKLNLIKKIGAERFQLLISTRHLNVKWDRIELRDIIEKYK